MALARFGIGPHGFRPRHSSIVQNAARPEENGSILQGFRGATPRCTTIGWRQQESTIRRKRQGILRTSHGVGPQCNFTAKDIRKNLHGISKGLPASCPIHELEWSTKESVRFTLRVMNLTIRFGMILWLPCRGRRIDQRRELIKGRRVVYATIERVHQRALLFPGAFGSHTAIEDSIRFGRSLLKRRWCPNKGRTGNGSSQWHMNAGRRHDPTFNQ
mmetsp:Transcript_8870/g.19155  ORF Transcript_8870/g.19155 Transcript_8870/m.19155 type:complete len:216 (+) Transcript_8870:315-962(+)